ncbi:PH domain-containing protein [Phaeodactylibacter sp.]|uniref:PH domain-containing protein n=1 Tax=Phaeodactylibacter sp. TaxID=1940289 RepID=UPI0025D25713|nr:PH domain-containing protein [Phaeodactylibacter sp.]MCI4650083.1 PH domain-containing protein [Phaeodactylibacter sp.]MCI5091716.1 PH domain-containing protein [Phaeodactylibacter sp.]
MKRSELNFLEPRRQAQAAIAIFIYKFVVRILRAAWPILLVFLFRSNKEQSNTELLMNAVVVIGGLFSLGVSVVAYFRYFFHLEEDQLVIQKGVFNRSLTKLPFERIQNLYIEQNVLHRLLGVVSLRVDSAGSSGHEVTIDALERKDAEAMRAYVLEQKREEAQEQTGLAPETSGQSAPVAQSLVLRLTFEDLLRIGVTQNHLATAGVIVGTVFGFLFTVAGAFEQDLVKTLIERWPMLQPGFWGFLILAAILFVVAFFLTLIRTVTQHYDLQFFESREGFQLKAGLFNRREASMQKRKIQLIRWTDNPLRRLLGLFRVSIHQAISGSERAAEQISIPGCKSVQVDDVVHSSFEGSGEAVFRGHSISKAYFIWYIRFTFLPAVVFGALGYFLQEPRFALPAIGFPVLGGLYLWLYQERFQLWLSPEYLKTSEGVLGRTMTLLPVYKVQSVRIRQSFFQRRRSLASVELYTAGGSVRVPFLPLDLARALQDYVLYRVESRREDWM